MPRVNASDVLLKVAELDGATGEELLHELGFDGTEQAISDAQSKRWVVEDSESVWRMTEEGQQALASAIST